MVGKRAVRFWVYIEFIAARLPTLHIKIEKKKFNTSKKSAAFVRSKFILRFSFLLFCFDDRNDLFLERHQEARHCVATKKSPPYWLKPLKKTTLSGFSIQYDITIKNHPFGILYES
jgi:hypothetical protein